MLQLLVGLAFAAILALTTAPTAMAVNYTVSANPYSATHTLAPSDLWNTYELTAANGQNIAYSMNVTTPGGCAMLLFVKGHNANGQSQYAPSYSQETCATKYSNSFPVASSDGTQFTLLLLTSQNDNVTYTVTAHVTTPLIPSWVLGLLIVVAAVVVVAVIRVLLRRRRKPAMMPPLAPPPPAPPQYPPQPPYGPPPTQP